MKGIFEITWADKKNKPAVAFDIKEVSDGSVPGIPAGIPIKGGQSEYHLIEISEEIDNASDVPAALNLIKDYLKEQGIEVINFSDRLPIK